MWTSLNFGGSSKTERTVRKYLQEDSWFEFEQDGSIGVGAILADGQKIINYFSSFRDFSGESR